MKNNNDITFINTHASVRAKHAIEKIGGVSVLIAEFNRVGNFTHIPGVGPDTDKELQRLTKRLIKHNKHLIAIDTPKQEPPGNQSLSQIYGYSVSMLSSRAGHILNNIESFYTLPDSSTDIKQLINDYIYNKINLRKFQNLGAKTEEELKMFFKIVMDAHLNGEQNNSMFGAHRKKIVHERLSFYPEIGPNARSAIIQAKNKYNFLNAVAFYLLVKKKGGTFKKVVREYYFSHQILNKTQVADIAGCSKERVRQVIEEIESKIVNQITVALYANYSGKFTLKFTNTKKDVIIVQPEKYESIKLFDLPTINSRFINLVAEHYFKKEGYISLNAIINSEIENFKYFDSRKSLVYCRVKGLNDIIWKKLLTNIHSRISTNLNSGIQYKFETLVIDECKRSKISIPANNLNSVLKALRKLTRNLTNTFDEAIFNKLKLQNKIVEYTHQFIDSKGKGVSSDLILSYLQKKNIILTKSQLLHILQYRNVLIDYTSLTGWKLKAWPEVENEAKNIQDFVIKYLKNSNDPVHISVLLDRIGQYRKISMESLYDNLRIHKSKEIVRFNCGFWGLSDKKYPAKWSKLPKFYNKIFEELGNDNLSKQHLNKIATEIEKKHHVPKIHTLFVYRNKKGEL